MARVLNDNVWVDSVLYRVGTTPPPEVAARIGDHAWEGVDEQVPTALPEPCIGVDTKDLVDVTPPPMQGKGSTLQAWTEYAESLGVHVDPSWTRSRVIDALAAIGLTTAPAGVS